MYIGSRYVKLKWKSLWKVAFSPFSAFSDLNIRVTAMCRTVLERGGLQLSNAPRHGGVALL